MRDVLRPRDAEEEAGQLLDVLPGTHVGGRFTKADFSQYYVHCKDPLPMDVEFMLSDSMEVRRHVPLPWPDHSTALQAVRPKLTFAKSLEEAAVAVDEMINNAFQTGPADGEVLASHASYKRLNAY